MNELLLFWARVSSFIWEEMIASVLEEWLLDLSYYQLGMILYWELFGP